MWVFLDGKFVLEENALVSIFDRSFRYGDALFEAVLVRHGKMFRWAQHAARLKRSADALKLSLPCSLDQMLASVRELISINQMRDAVLRIQLSRGTGPRGYAPTGEEKPLLVMSLHPTPSRPLPEMLWKVMISSLRIAAHDPLAHHKTCSRLLQVMVAAEARERGVDESLIVNTDGHVTEGSTSNVFWIQAGQVCTPPLQAGVLPGITRSAIFEICDTHGIPRMERMIRPDELLACEGMFLSFTSRGIVEVDSLEGKPLPRSGITAQLRQEFEALLERECSS
jgi:branched-chain amino acid aminotransferase